MRVPVTGLDGLAQPEFSEMVRLDQIAEFLLPRRRSDDRDVVEVVGRGSLDGLLRHFADVPNSR
jgi:hypothetical protein